MYEQFYGFSTTPFVPQPATGDYYFCEQHRQVVDALATRIRRGGCTCLLYGPAGVGKSTLIHAVGEALGDGIVVSAIDAAETAGGAPLAVRFLASAGVECAADSEAALVKYLAAYRHTLSEEGKRTLLVVDNTEALTAPDCRALETLVDGEGDQPVQVLFLTARPELWSASEETPCAALAQHIVERYSVAPLSPVETDDYIRHRLTQAGGSPELFTPAASAAVYRYSEGVPRLINRICDLALVYGFSRQSPRIDQETMDFVLNDRWGGSQQRDSGVRPPVEPAVEQAPERVPAAAPETNPPAADPTPAVAEGNALLAQQLVDLLKNQGGANAGEAPPRPVSDRDMYDFIRLSLRYHQRHVERFVLGIVVGVALLAAGGLWTLITWQNDQIMPSAVASNPLPYQGDTAMRASLPAMAVPVTADSPTKAKETPAVSAAAPVAAVPVPDHAAAATAPPTSTTRQASAPEPKPEPEVKPEVKQASAAPAVDAEKRALKRAQQKLERERKTFEKRLAAERAKRAELKKENERREEQARQAKALAEDARKNARAAWSWAHPDTPDAFPEE